MLRAPHKIRAGFIMASQYCFPNGACRAVVSLTTGPLDGVRRELGWRHDA